MADKIPDHILARDGDKPEDFKAQQDRLAEWVLDKRIAELERHANGGK